MKRILLGSASVAAGNIGGAGLLAAFMLVVAQKLAVQEFGVLAALYAAALLTSDLTDFGTGLRMVLRAASLSAHRVDARCKALLMGRLGLHAVLLLPVAFIGIVSGDFVTWAAAWILSLVTAVRVLLQARERARRAYLQSSFMIVFERAVALVILIATPNTDVASALLCLAAGAAVASFVGLRTFDWRSRPAPLVAQYRAAIPVGVSSAGSSMSQLEVPLVAGLSGAASAGEYAVAARLLSPVTFLPAALSSVLARELPGMPIREARRTVYSMLVVSTVSVGGLAGVLVALAPTISSLLGPDYASATLPIQIAAGTSILVAGRQTFQVALQSRNLLHFVARATLLGTLAYLALLGLGALLAGAVGASFGALAGQFVLLMVLAARWARLVRSDRG